ncbi:site-specific tyrosine recombinase/integron integrase [Salegentibacter chungangensis]|uniref:Site-specific tyrosine recombinase/integron integrase n=1 Tax=Salegentibacter chungangensis TaxID=1335724 RepID=A0ABW3NUS8_9FLAO
MIRIQLFPFELQNEVFIGISFSFNAEVKTHLKNLPGIQWNTTRNCYFIPYSYENKSRLFNHLREKGWFVDYTALQKVKNGKLSPKKKTEPVLSPENESLLKEYTEYLNGKRYSESTIRTYRNFAQQFIVFQNKAPEEITNRDLERFVELQIAGKAYSISSHRQCISALMHFFKVFKNTEIDTDNIERPGKSKYLPGVLSKEEVIDLLRATRNLKHRAILALIYSSGLRIGELLKLKLSDIDIDRRQVKVKMAKGRKDRYAILADSFIPLLYNYVGTYKPKGYFVEGQSGGIYTGSSIRSFLKESCRRAGITKKVTPHTLRHSYATHMLENGIDIRYIQELLGHSRPETTMIYTHVAQKDLNKIKSPLDIAIKEFQDSGKGDPDLRLSRKFLE